MKVLFDHNVPRKLRRHLPQHVVSTAEEMNWHELENGYLIAAAERAGFDVMVTCDKNLSYQQNLTGRTLALVVLETNNWNVLKAQTIRFADAVGRVTTGSFEHVFLAPASFSKLRHRGTAT